MKVEELSRVYITGSTNLSRSTWNYVYDTFNAWEKFHLLTVLVNEKYAIRLTESEPSYKEARETNIPAVWAVQLEECAMRFAKSGAHMPVTDENGRTAWHLNLLIGRVMGHQLWSLMHENKKQKFLQLYEKRLAACRSAHSLGSQNAQNEIIDTSNIGKPCFMSAESRASEQHFFAEAVAAFMQITTHNTLARFDPELYVELACVVVSPPKNFYLSATTCEVLSSLGVFVGDSESYDEKLERLTVLIADTDDIFEARVQLSKQWQVAENDERTAPPRRQGLSLEKRRLISEFRDLLSRIANVTHEPGDIARDIQAISQGAQSYTGYNDQQREMLDSLSIAFPAGVRLTNQSCEGPGYGKMLVPLECDSFPLLTSLCQYDSKNGTVYGVHWANMLMRLNYEMLNCPGVSRVRIKEGLWVINATLIKKLYSDYRPKKPTSRADDPAGIILKTLNTYRSSFIGPVAFALGAHRNPLNPVPDLVTANRILSEEVMNRLSDAIRKSNLKNKGSANELMTRVRTSFYEEDFTSRCRELLGYSEASSRYLENSDDVHALLEKYDKVCGSKFSNCAAHFFPVIHSIVQNLSKRRAS